MFFTVPSPSRPSTSEYHSDRQATPWVRRGYFGADRGCSAFRMRLGKRIQKRPRPAIHVMGEHLASQGPHPAPPLLDWLAERRLNRVLDPFEVVRVDQIGLPSSAAAPVNSLSTSAPPRS